MRRYIIIALIILLAGAIYLTNFFISKQRSFGENARLKQENENLKAQLQESQISGIKSQDLNNSPLTAEVFSTYPFNTKNQITINAGEKQGVKKSMTASIGGNILLGRVVDVFENYSVIETIFDPNFQLPVRIGNQQIDALFQGGNEPKLSLIEKTKPVKTSDIVYSASKEFIYGLKVGEVAEIRESSAGVFKEATLTIPFNMNELREVNLLQ